MFKLIFQGQSSSICVMKVSSVASDFFMQLNAHLVQFIYLLIVKLNLCKDLLVFKR